MDTKHTKRQTNQIRTTNLKPFHKDTHRKQRQKYTKKQRQNYTTKTKAKLHIKKRQNYKKETLKKINYRKT